MNVNFQHEIVRKVLYVFLTIFFLYSFWYQYAFSPIGGVFSFLGAIILLLSIMNIRFSWYYYRDFLPIVIFIVLLIFTAFFLSFFPEAAITRATSVFEYLIPMLGIFTYVDSNLRQFQKILTSLSWTITILAISSLILGHKTNTGAIAIGSLNVNVEASLLSLGFVSNIILLGMKDSTRFYKLFLLISTVLLFKAEIDCASRRGFVVAAFVLSLGFLFLFVKWFKGKPILKFLVILVTGITAISLASSLYEALRSTALFTRFLNTGYTGDTGRVVLKQKAFELFIKAPLFGAGMGAVEKIAGYYSHSFYYELLGCTGLLGFLLIMYILLRHFFGYIRLCIKFKNNDDTYEDNVLFVVKGIILLICSILIGGVAVVYIYDMYFYVMISLMLSADSIITNTTRFYE